MMGVSKSEFLRFASPNERRTISREDVGFYHAVIVGGVYGFDSGDIDLKSPSSFFYPLQQCIEEHSILSVVVGDSHADKPFYERVSRMNLEDHIWIFDDLEGHDDLEVINSAIERDLDRPFPSGIPPWRIVVYPLKSASQCYVGFSFSHTTSDGASGMAFHKSFLKGCRDMTRTRVTASSSTIQTVKRPLHPPFDTPERLPISWSFLLTPFLAQFLPTFLVEWLGLRVGASGVDAGSWLASRIQFNKDINRTRVKTHELDAPALAKALQATRAHEARLTGTLGQIIARALSREVTDPNADNFVAQSAVNMRKAIGVPEEEMGEYASGIYLRFPRVTNLESGRLSEEEWENARGATRSYATAAASLQDQAIGLLRYVPNIRKWTLGKIGCARDSSFGLSNLGACEVGPRDKKSEVKLVKLVFAQPGAVAGAVVTFNVVSLKGGSLMYTVTWLTDTLGMPVEEEEAFVDRLCESVNADFRALV